METLIAPPAISFVVQGRPQQVGSKSPWIPKMRDGSPLTKNGRIVIATMDSNKNSKSWMAEVRGAARAAFPGELFRGPIRLSVLFYFIRPGSHYGSGKNAGRMKDSAPEYFCQSPDLDKLVRAIGDALSGTVYVDDKQVCSFGQIEKRWTTSAERAEITVEEMA